MNEAGVPERTEWTTGGTARETGRQSAVARPSEHVRGRQEAGRRQPPVRVHAAPPGGVGEVEREETCPAEGAVGSLRAGTCPHNLNTEPSLAHSRHSINDHVYFTAAVLLHVHSASLVPCPVPDALRLP